MHALPKGTIQVSRNAEGGEKFRGKSVTKVYGSMLSALQGSGWVSLFQKKSFTLRQTVKRYYWPLTYHWPLTCSSAATMYMARIGRTAPFIVIDVEIFFNSMPSKSSCKRVALERWLLQRQTNGQLYLYLRWIATFCGKEWITPWDRYSTLSSSSSQLQQNSNFSVVL